MKLNNENIEEYLLLLADKELSGGEEEQVRLYVAANEAWKPVMDAYLAACLDDGETFVFPDKDMLLQPEENVVAMPVRTKSMPVWRIAAAVAVLIGLGFAMSRLLSPGQAGNEPEVANKTSMMRPAQTLPQATNRPAASQPVQVAATAVAQRQDASRRSPARGHQAPPQLVATLTPTMRIQAVPETLESASLNKVSVAIGAKAEPLVMQEQEQTVAVADEHKGLPEWLPVNEENLQGVNALIAHIQDLKENMQEKAQSLRNTAFVIRIGDRQIPLNK